MKRILIILNFITTFLFAQTEKEKGTPLLEDYAIAHSNQNKNLTGYEDIEYVWDISNCTPEIINTIEIWRNRVNAIPTSYQKEKSRVRLAIGISQHLEGEIIIIYRFFSQDKYAYISILYDGNEKITNNEREILIRYYDLINLKRELISCMSCESQ